MRRVDRFCGLIIGLALAGAAGLCGVEVMALILGNRAMIVPRGSWDRQLRHVGWDSTGVVVAAAVMAGVGVVLLAIQLLPRRLVRLLLRSPPGQRLWVSRRGLARRLAGDITALGAVRDGRVRVGRRRVTARVVLEAGTSRSPEADDVASVAARTLAGLGTVDDLRVRVKAKAGNDPPATRPQPTAERVR